MFDCYDLLNKVEHYTVMSTGKGSGKNELRWEIRLHGRGGQGVVTASKIIAESAFLDGFQSQSIPFFGAERRGAPVMAFTRISNKVIRERSQIYNPDYIVILDPLVMRVADVFSGFRGGGIVINSSSTLDPELFPNFDLTIAKIDGIDIATKCDLFVAGNPVVNVPVIGAFLKIFPEIEIETVKDVLSKKFGEKSVEALYLAYDETEIVKLRGKRREKRAQTKETKRIWIPVSKPKKGVAGLTGYWRDYRPSIDYGKCTNCLNCWIHCPEGSITRESFFVEINYEFCKGCLICASVCPKKAIFFEREVFA